MVATAFIASLSVFRIFENIISYIQTQLSIIASEIPQELLIESGTAVSELEAIFNSETTTTALLTSIGSLAVALIGVSFVFLLLKYLLEKNQTFSYCNYFWFCISTGVVKYISSIYRLSFTQLY